MFEAHTILNFLARQEPMTMQQLKIDKVRADLDQLREEVDSLKAKSDNSGNSRQSRFFRYLERIDDKRDSVNEQIRALETTGENTWGEIRDELKEAQQRLAIAKLAARSRFH